MFSSVQWSILCATEAEHLLQNCGAINIYFIYLFLLCSKRHRENFTFTRAEAISRVWLVDKEGFRLFSLCAERQYCSDLNGSDHAAEPCSLGTVCGVRGTNTAGFVCTPQLEPLGRVMLCSEWSVLIKDRIVCLKISRRRGSGSQRVLFPPWAAD